MKEHIKENYKKLVIIIFLLGIILRIVYGIKNPILKNQYDCKIWSLSSLEEYEKAYKRDDEVIGKKGHLDYIMLIYNEMKLPDDLGGQYYHPPLHHFICAMWLKFMDIFPFNAVQKIESLQFLSLIYSALILLFAYLIIEKLDIKEIGKILIYIFLNFFPLFIYMSGFINNDLLITMFVMACLYFLIRWDEEPNIKNTVKIALAFGLGMMTKISIITMMIPIVIVVIKKIFDRIGKKEKTTEIIIQILVFILIAGSLSSWYSIRNYIKFGCAPLEIQKPYDHFYSGDAPFLERWGFFSKDMLKNVIGVKDKNIFASVINSSLYCLYEFKNFYGIAIKTISLILVACFGISFLIRFFKIIKENKKLKKTEYIILITFLSWIIAFIDFNISLPYSCTMNSRYIAILFIIGMIYLGNLVSETKSKYIVIILYILVIALSIFSLPVAMR